MSYFNAMEQIGQMNIFYYMALDSLKIDETVAFQDVKITRQSRFYEVETYHVHEVVYYVEEALDLLIGY